MTSTASRPGRSSGSLRRASRSTPCWQRPSRSPSATYVLALSHTGYTTNLPLADVTGGKAWVVWDYEGRPLEVGARRPGPAARAAPVLLEERQVGRRPPALGPRRAGLLGGQRLPRPRRPLARAALPGRLRWTRRRPVPAGRWRAVEQSQERRPSEREDLPPRALGSPSAHLAGQHFVVRLTAPDGYTASRSYSVASAPAARRGFAEHRADRRAARGRRGLLLPARRGRPRGRARGAGPDRGVVRVARRHAGAPRRRRIGDRAA